MSQTWAEVPQEGEGGERDGVLFIVSVLEPRHSCISCIESNISSGVCVYIMGNLATITFLEGNNIH
jgi:hypothetical protein